ncbi:hypothetical protein Tsubulata_000461 [Turnera subulata]|uniref:BZIP domain-containing protein n=1 Tax=Turnera subulata TaxID=218843 RepID=A0A9Q0G1A5_9ROSI|nr:hypothetical protein Tsubulata_000461 [Turnera subulata]
MKICLFQCAGEQLIKCQEYMEVLNKNTNRKSPPWSRRPIEMRPFNHIMPSLPPSSLPLASTSFQVWRKPSSPINHGDVSSVGTNKSTFNQLDALQKVPLSAANDNRKLADHQKPSNKNLISDNLVTTNDKPVKSKTTNVHLQIRSGRNLDPKMDPKKLKRIISNRVSAQKSRLKKLQYVAEMERRVKALEHEIALLSPKVALYRSRQQFLQIEHNKLNTEMSAHANNKMSMSKQSVDPSEKI